MNWTAKFVVAKFSLACLVGIALAAGGGNALAQNAYWSGAVDTDWTNPGNWTGDDDGVVAPEIFDGPPVLGNPAPTGNEVVTGVIGTTPVRTGGPAFTNFPVIGPGQAGDADGIHINRSFNETIDTTVTASLTVDGGTLRVLDGGVFMGRNDDAARYAFNVINGGTVQVGGITGPDSPNFPIPSGPIPFHVARGTSNILVDGPGSRLVLSRELRYTGSSSDDRNPRPGSGIVVSNGGYLQTGELRLERLDGLDGLDGDNSSHLTGGVGSNAGFLDIVGPGSSVKLFDALVSEPLAVTLLEKIRHMIDVDGVIVADGGSMIVGITDTGDGGYLLTSVPEPSAIVLLGMSLAGFVARRRR